MGEKEMVLFFGCNGQPGHYLIDVTGRSLNRDACDRLRVPTDAELDASDLFLPYPERTGQGVLTYLPAPNRSILAWWGSPFDQRGKVNNAIIVDGKQPSLICWERFMRGFPQIATQLKYPEVRE